MTDLTPDGPLVTWILRKSPLFLCAVSARFASRPVWIRNDPKKTALCR